MQRTARSISTLFDIRRHLTFTGLILRDTLGIGGPRLGGGGALPNDLHLRAAMEWLCRAQDVAAELLHEVLPVFRVLIARALACEPDLLLLDEPTASLDPTVQEDVHALLRDLNQRLGIIMVSHDLGFVSLYFKTVICVNRDIHVHATGDLTQERVARMYGREVRLLLHAEKAGGDR